MNRFQELYKLKNLSNQENLNFNHQQHVKSQKTKRSQVFDLRRGFITEVQEPLKPSKEKAKHISNNKLHKYTIKKVPDKKKEPPPFVVGKVRHKIHSPPFLHGPMVEIESKKRVPLTSLKDGISQILMNDSITLIDNDKISNFMEAEHNLLSHSILSMSKNCKNPSNKVSSEREMYIFPCTSQQLLKNSEDEFSLLQQSPLRVSNMRKQLVYETPSPSKETSKDMHAITACIESAIATQEVVDLTESPERENFFAYKALQDTIEKQKQIIETIDLLSDEEDEQLTFLNNMLKKYSVIPSPKSENRNSMSSFKNLPVISISPYKTPVKNISEVSDFLPDKEVCLSRVLSLRNRNVAITPSPKKSTPRIRKNDAK